MIISTLIYAGLNLVSNEIAFAGGFSSGMAYELEKKRIELENRESAIKKEVSAKRIELENKENLLRNQLRKKIEEKLQVVKDNNNKVILEETRILRDEKSREVDFLKNELEDLKYDKRDLETNFVKNELEDIKRDKRDIEVEKRDIRKDELLEKKKETRLSLIGIPVFFLSQLIFSEAQIHTYFDPKNKFYKGLRFAWCMGFQSIMNIVLFGSWKIVLYDNVLVAVSIWTGRYIDEIEQK